MLTAPYHSARIYTSSSYLRGGGTFRITSVVLSVETIHIPRAAGGGVRPPERQVSLQYVDELGKLDSNSVALLAYS